MDDGRIKTCPLCGKPNYTHHICTSKKPNDCPYCGAELVTKNTYGIEIHQSGMGGDECWDYCPECEQEIH